MQNACEPFQVGSLSGTTMQKEIQRPIIIEIGLRPEASVNAFLSPRNGTVAPTRQNTNFVSPGLEPGCRLWTAQFVSTQMERRVGAGQEKELHSIVLVRPRADLTAIEIRPRLRSQWGDRQTACTAEASASFDLPLS